MKLELKKQIPFKVAYDMIEKEKKEKRVTLIKN